MEVVLPVLALVAFYIVPPPAMVLLVVWLWKLGSPALPPGGWRVGRLVLIGLLAAGLSYALYHWLRVASQPIPSAHGAAHSMAPWVREHPVLATLLPLAGIAAAMAFSQARQLASLSFTVGVLLAGGLFLLPPYLAQQTAQRLAQARQDSRTYEETGWQFAIKDSFQLEVVRRGNLYAPIPGMQPPEFPGGEAALTQQLARLVAPASIPDAYRVGFPATVEVSFILEKTGRPNLAHVSSGLGPGYDEAAVRAVAQLPPFRPARRANGQPVVIVWQVAVPFEK